MNDRLTALRVLLRTARLRSFSAAARELGMSQSSVSRIVGDLETELGISLLHRTTRAVTPTEAGAEYLERASAILEAVDEADQAVRGDGTLSGRLRIGLSSSFGLREVVPRLPAFLNSHPNLSVDLVVSDLHQDLVAEGIDVAFRLGRMIDSVLIARSIAKSQRVLAASPEYLATHPTIRTPNDLSDHEVILGPAIIPSDLAATRGLERQAVRVKGRVSCAVNEGATAAARAGLGLTVSSLWGVADELESGVLVRVLPDWDFGEATVYAVFPPGRPRAAATVLATWISQRL